MQLTDEQIAAIKQKTIDLWNSEADKFNQWHNLGRDEQDDLFARAVLQAASAALAAGVPEWISVQDRLPAIDMTKPEHSRQVKVLASWGPNRVAEMTYTSNPYAKTEKGRAYRFEWQGRISPWAVTHWMPLPAAPSYAEKECK